MTKAKKTDSKQKEAMAKKEKSKQMPASCTSDEPKYSQHMSKSILCQAENGKTFLEKCCDVNNRKILVHGLAKKPFKSKFWEQIDSYQRVYGIPNAFFMELIQILKKHNVYRRIRGGIFEIRIEGIPIQFSEDKIHIDVDNYIKSQYAPPQMQIETGVFTDPRDGKTYKTVKIGERVWLAENLNWEGAGVVNGKGYGRLYTWEEALKVAPTDWHLPTYDEWAALIGYAGGAAGGNAATALISEAWGGMDVLGFSALPAGYRDGDGGFYHAAHEGWWWGEMVKYNEIPCARKINFRDDNVSAGCYTKNKSLSVRLIQEVIV